MRYPLNTKLLGSAAKRLALAPAILLAITGCSDGPNGSPASQADPSVNTRIPSQTAGAAGAAATNAADRYAEQWGPALGSTLPLLAAADQDGNARSLGNLSGKNGLLLFFNRSADW